MRKFAYPDQQQAYVQGLADGVHEHAEMGARIERERIVALLKAALVVWRGADQGAVYGAEACLALLEGEQS